MGVRHSKQADHSDDPLDFGPLVPRDTNATTSWDYDTKVVKRLIKEGRLAPFYQGKRQKGWFAPPCINRTVSIAGYYDRPDIRNGSQVDLLTSASHGLLQQTNLAVTKSESSMLAMAAERMGLLLARHIPENVQRYVLYKDSVECPICFLVSSRFYYYEGPSSHSVSCVIIVLSSFYKPYSVL